MGFSFSSRPVEKNVYEYERVGYSVHGNERGDTSGDDGDERWYISGDDGDKMGDITVDDNIRGFRSQETSQYSFSNCGESIDGDCRGGH